MKKTYRKTVLLMMIATIFSVFSCRHYYFEDETHHRRIHFINWGNKAIYIRGMIDRNWYPDPFISHSLERFNHINLQDEILAHNFGKIMPGKINYDLMDLLDDYYEYHIVDKDSVVFSVFDGEHLEANDSDSFIVCYLLSLEDLKKLHFQVSYPPTEDMKDVYMYPSYDEVIRQNRPNDTGE